MSRKNLERKIFCLRLFEVEMRLKTEYCIILDFKEKKAPKPAEAGKTDFI